MICPSCRSENQAGAEVCFHCRAVLGAITRGSLLDGRYEVRDLLGRGGMGLVYEAVDAERGEAVALKVLRSELLARADMARRFRTEVELARRVRHPNVCRIVDGGEDRGRPFVVMERVVGSTLKARLAEGGPLPAAEACDVVRQAALGLAAIHAAGIVHRDLKPANLMAERGGHVRVMDFGIATRPEDGATGPTGSGYAVGSPEYMSPEQARGRPLEARSDLYALGIVLFELLTGRVPFKGDTPVATLLLHLEAPPPLRGTGGAERIPEALVPLLERALAKEPASRFGSAAEMAEALRLAEAGLAGRSRPANPVPAAPSRSEPADLARRSGPGYAAAWALAGAALLGAAFTFLRPPGPGILAPVPPATAPAVDATPSGRSSAADTGVASPEFTPPQTARPGETGPRPSISQQTRREASVEALPQAGPTSAPASGPSAPPPAEPGAGATGGAQPPPGSTAGPAVAEKAAELASAAPATGALLVLATPWADVSVDGRVVGQTPLARIPLAEGPHSVLLIHPDYQPYPRRVTIRSGETLRLVVDFAVDGVKRRR